MPLPEGPYQLFPPLASHEYAALRADIAARGVMVPVEVDEHGHILDGHHRKAIADELGITCPTITRAFASEQEKRTHVRVLNMARRHLTREQFREQLMEELKERPERSDRLIAAGLGVSHVTVGAVRRDMEATGQIDQLERHVGADGKERPATARTELEGRGEFPHVEQRTDTLGWQQPTGGPVAVRVVSDKAGATPARGMVPISVVVSRRDEADLGAAPPVADTEDDAALFNRILDVTGGREAVEQAALRRQFLDAFTRVSMLTGYEPGRVAPALVRGKGARQREVALPTRTVRALNAYRRALPVAAPQCFLNERFQLPVSPDRLREIVALIGRRAGINGLHPHMLRHSFAIRFLTRSPGALFELQKILGHSSLEMVRHYANLSTEHVLARHRQVMND